MTPQIIDGEKIAEEIINEIEPPEGTPKLQIIYVGENRASEVFIKEKTEAAEKIGFEADVEKFPQEVDETEVTEFIKKKNQDQKVDGILVQLPLPEQIDNNTIFETVSPKKDVDCLTPENLGKLLRGNAWIKPCAVEGIERILKSEQIELEGKKVTLINNSNLIGKPLSMDLTQKDATVTLCHEKTENLIEHTRDADIIVTATGEKGLIEDEMVSEDTVVIDAGYSYTEGDLNQETENLDDISKLSSVPGGLGPVTVAMTMKNLVKCFERTSQARSQA